MLRLIKYFFFIFVISPFTSVWALQSDWSNGTESQVRLISPITHNNGLDNIYVGLEYKLQEGWKTYWQSPGDGGFPQEITWNNSTNIQSLEISWPTPEQFEILSFKSAGYTNHVIFPIQLTLEDFSQPTSVVLDVTYLVCKEICIPGSAHLELFIPVGKGFLTSHSYNIEKSLSQLPERNLQISFIQNMDIQAYADEKTVSFVVKANAKEFFENPKVFLHTGFGLPVIEPIISLSADAKDLETTFNFNKKLINAKAFDAQVVIADNNRSFLFAAPLKVETSSASKYPGPSFIIIIMIALLGGLILNGMPCVLPVLSIKLLSILQHIERPSSIRMSFMVTSFGIVCSFGLLAFFFVLLRYLGVSVVWGMQFQQPIFLMIIAFILAFFSLNLFGLFEIPVPRFINLGIINQFQENNFTRDFFNGFFATLMATPCSAPFVGTALTFAFTQSPMIMIVVFVAMGFGMALPYLLISLFPQLIKFFPQPGPWMKYLKYFLGCLLLATLVWIGNVLLNHFNYYFITVTIILFVGYILLIYFFKYKTFIFIAILVLFFSLPNFAVFKSINLRDDSGWLDLTTINLKQLISENDIVFVDITADWCATCQFNKINVLQKKSIQDLFAKNNVVRVRGDWTKPDSAIESFLQQYQRFGIPLNVVYSKNNPQEIILSELLSEKKILKAFNTLLLNE
jgi:suppressor for copper-sensitivity B